MNETDWNLNLPYFPTQLTPPPWWKQGVSRTPTLYQFWQNFPGGSAPRPRYSLEFPIVPAIKTIKNYRKNKNFWVKFFGARQNEKEVKLIFMHQKIPKNILKSNYSYVWIWKGLVVLTEHLFGIFLSIILICLQAERSGANSGSSTSASVPCSTTSWKWSSW